MLPPLPDALMLPAATAAAALVIAVLVFGVPCKDGFCFLFFRGGKNIVSDEKDAAAPTYHNTLLLTKTHKKLKLTAQNLLDPKVRESHVAWNHVQNDKIADSLLKMSGMEDVDDGQGDPCDAFVEVDCGGGKGGVYCVFGYDNAVVRKFADGLDKAQ